MRLLDWLLSPRVRAIQAENERLKKIFKSCDWFWDPDDRECCIEGPREILDNVKFGTVVEVERGGVVEVSYHARLPNALDSDSDDFWECDCATEAEAKAAVIAEQNRRALLTIGA